jgi:hypothetical protein
MIVIQEGFSSIHVEEMLKSIRPLLPKYFMVLEAMEVGNQPPQRMITEMDARLPADKKGIARYFVLTQGVDRPNPFITLNILSKGLGISGEGYDWLAPFALELQTEAVIHTFATMKNFQAAVVERFVNSLYAKAFVPKMEKLLSTEKFKQFVFIFHVCGEPLDKLENLLKRVYGNRSRVAIPSAERQVDGCIRMSKQYIEVLRTQDDLTDFRNGQKGVLAGLFGELRTLGRLQPSTVMKGKHAVSSVIYGEQDVDMELPLPGGKIALVEVAASIPKLLDKLGPNGIGQRQRYEAAVSKVPFKLEMAYTADVMNWFDMYSGGNISPAARCLNAGRGLLLDGIYLNTAELRRSIEKVEQLKAQLKVGFPLLAYKLNQSKILYKTFIEADIVKLKSAL